VPTIPLDRSLSLQARYKEGPLSFSLNSLRFFKSNN
jgi:hypothetical protein